MPQNKLTVNQFRITTTLKPEYAHYCLAPIFQSDWETKGRFSTFPSAWLCGNPFGFTLFTDTDMNWIFNEEPLRMQKNPDGSATMAAHFIDLPTQVACDVPYTLAMMATPSKPPRQSASWPTASSREMSAISAAARSSPLRRPSLSRGCEQINRASFSLY